MTLRDWFAGQALAGLIARSEHPGSMGEPKEISNDAYRIADAMLAERAKGGA
jgi:hypothetical protein